MHFDCRFKRDHQGNDHSVHVLSNKNPSKCVKPVLSPSPTREAPGSLSVSKSSDSSAHDCFRKSYKDFCAGHSCAIQYQHFRDWRWKDLWTLLNFSKYQRTLQKFLQTNRQNISKHIKTSNPIKPLEEGNHIPSEGVEQELLVFLGFW